MPLYSSAVSLFAVKCATTITSILRNYNLHTLIGKVQLSQLHQKTPIKQHFLQGNFRKHNRLANSPRGIQYK